MSADTRYAALSGIRGRHAIGHQPTSNPLYCAENDGLSAVYCEVGFLLAEVARLKAMLGDLPRSIEAALQPTGDHHILPDGYCLDCQGGCMLGFAEDNAKAIRDAAYAGPSPFTLAPCLRCGAATFRPDPVMGRRQARRCEACGRSVGNCNCPEKTA